MKKILLLVLSLLCMLGCATIVPENVCPPKDYRSYKKKANKPAAPILMQEAISSTNIQNLKCMMAAGFDSNMILQENSGTTPLIYSSKNGNKATTKIILDSGAKINYQTPSGVTALITAINNHDIEILSLLLARGASIEKRDRNGDNALLHAATVGDLKTIEVLIANNADINIKNYKGETPLIKAKDHNHYDIVKFFLLHGAELNYGDIIDILFQSIKNADLDLLSIVLKKNPSFINIKDETGKTLLINAILTNNINMVNFLLTNGADINMPDDEYGITPIMYATREGFEEIFFLLLNSGADPNIKSKSEISAINMFSKSFNVTILNALIKKGGNVNENPHITPLMSYIVDSGVGGENGNEEFLDALLKNKVNIDAQDKRGRTALMDATLFIQHDLVKKLLKYRPNINLKDQEGHSLIYHAVNSAKLVGGDLYKTILDYSKKYNNTNDNFWIEMEYLLTTTDYNRKSWDDNQRKYYERKGYPEIAIENEIKKSRKELFSSYTRQIANDYGYKHAVEYINAQKDLLYYSDYLSIVKEYELNNLVEQVLTNPKKFMKKDGSINEVLIEKLAPNATPLELIEATITLRKK